MERDPSGTQSHQKNENAHPAEVRSPGRAIRKACHGDGSPQGFMATRTVSLRLQDYRFKSHEVNGRMVDQAAEIAGEPLGISQIVRLEPGKRCAILL